eukprot:CAMPEP_0113954160 /NCGR_PEP_ID=MMETSP0011_2-20120614/312_1 /TAXON_ID=101924 /ORGANISM="Rhodosorus marinus" /LENGTH=271 /DNA_ID=CAMNT_0000963085 /DNA_START=1126 /DNA_END=1941 /DNA_ORIENTATION=- /assembly_acc=CAM_ASM_000156
MTGFGFCTGLTGLQRARISGVCRMRASGMDEIAQLHVDAFKRLERRLGLIPSDHCAETLGGSSSFEFGPSHGKICGFVSPEVPWLAESQIRRDDNEFVRSRLLGFASSNSCVPHLDISIHAAMGGTMMRIDMIPRIDVIEEVRYRDTFCGESRQSLWESVTKQATAMFVNPDVNARALQSPCCISIISKNDEKVVNLLSQAIFSSIDAWSTWIETPPLTTSELDCSQVISQRDQKLNELLYSIERDSAAELFLDRNFATAYATALLGPRRP